MTALALRSALERRIRPDVRLLGRQLAWFQICGCVGLALAVSLTVSLAAHIGLSPVVMLAVAAVAVLSFFGLAIATKIVGQEERLVSYHHQLAALAVAALVLRATNQPVLSYLDLTSLGLGAFLAIGRLGCLMSGCCYGRPHRGGLAYTAAHLDGGLPTYLVGVRLVPVQALEAAWLLTIVLALLYAGYYGSALVAGSVFTSYLVAYAAGRFGFEFLRGDAQRPYWAGASEAQWTSAVCLGLVSFGEAVDMAPWQWWHIAALAGIGVVLAAVVLRNRHPDVLRDLGSPGHLREIAAALFPSSEASDVRIARTSLGIRVSASEMPPGTGLAAHYAFSLEVGNMSPELARALADIIVQLRPSLGEGRLRAGGSHVYHLFIGGRA